MPTASPASTKDRAEAKIDGRICALRRKRLSYDAIARKVGCGRDRVVKVAKANGLAQLGARNEVSAADKLMADGAVMAYIAECREKDTADMAMAKHLKCSRHAIAALRSAIGWARPHANLQPEARAARDAEIERLMGIHGGNVNRIAADIGLSRATVVFVVKKLRPLRDDIDAGDVVLFGTRLAAAAIAAGRPPERAFEDAPRAAAVSRIVAPRYMPTAREFIGAQSSAA